VWPDCITVLMLVWMILVVSPRAGQIKPFILKKNSIAQMYYYSKIYSTMYTTLLPRPPKLDGIVTTTKS
jgi:hypothetical protein